MTQTRRTTICLLALTVLLAQGTTSRAQKSKSVVELSLGEPADKTSTSSVMTVVVTGVGLNPGKAKENAFSNALEQVVGVLVDAETIVENDKVIRDQVHTLTSGFVEELDVIDTWQEDGLHFARIRAKVAAGKLGEKLEKQNVAVRKIPAALLYQRVKHEILNEANAKKMFRSATADFSPDKFMTVEVLDREPEVERTGQRVKLTITYRLSSNPSVCAVGRPTPGLGRGVLSERDHVEHSRTDATGPGLGKWDRGRFCRCHDAFQGVLIEIVEYTLTTIGTAG